MVDKTSLQHEWLFENNGDDNFASGDLATTGSVSYASGVTGQAVSLSGLGVANNLGVDITGDATFNLVGDWTADFWLYSTTVTDGANSGIIFGWVASGNLSIYSGWGTTGLGVQGNGVSTSRGTISATAWEHWAISTASNVITIYKNGVQQGATIAGWSGFGAHTDFKIGTQGASGSLPNGKIDGLRLWNRALAGSEALEIYNSNSDTVFGPATDSGSSTIGVLDTALDNNVGKYTHGDGYDFYVRDGAAGREGYSKAGTNVYLVDVVYNANSDAGQKYVASSTALNTLLRLNGENPDLMYEVTGSEETIATAYMKLSDGTLQSIGKAKAKEITLVNQTDVSYPLVLPLVAP